MAEPHATLVKVGREKGVLSLKTGQLNTVLQAAAVFHAGYQSDKGRLGHQNWDFRSAELFKALPEFTNMREVCAQSWNWETAVVEGAQSMFKAWEDSPGHWQWVNGSCSIWGYAMKFNPVLKLWFATGIFADRK